jgi:hypothetical protein
MGIAWDIMVGSVCWGAVGRAIDVDGDSSGGESCANGFDTTGGMAE